MLSSLSTQWSVSTVPIWALISTQAKFDKDIIETSYYNGNTERISSDLAYKGVETVGVLCESLLL